MATRGSSKWRYEAWGDPCPRTLTTISFSSTRITVNTKSVEAFTALATVLDAHRYQVREKDTGAYNCRHMRNDPSKPMSSHSWGTAVDINWQSNPDGRTLRTDMSRAMVDDIIAIKTNSRHQVFRWGGDWDSDGDSSDHSYVDAMHYELIVTPSELATGINWSTVKGTSPEVTVMKKLIYSKRGTADGSSVKAAEELAPQDGLVSTSSKETAQRARDEGVTVIAAGGPAYRDLVPPSQRKDSAGIHVHDNVQAVVGEVGIDTHIMLGQFAKNGWKP